MKARLINISVERGDSGRFFAKSPDMPNLMVSDRTVSGLLDAIPGAIEELYAAVGVQTQVHALEGHAFEAGEHGFGVARYVVVPTKAAVKSVA